VSFNPYHLDDLPLGVYEFRLFFRLIRRANVGLTSESLPTMARACQISERQTRYAIQTLLKRQLIRARVRHGQTNSYQVNPSSQWLLTPVPDAPRHDMHPSTTCTPASRAAPPLDGPRHEVLHPTSKNLEQYAENASPRQEVHPGITCTPAGHAAPNDLDVDVDFSFQTKSLLKQTSTSSTSDLIPTQAGDAPRQDLPGLPHLEQTNHLNQQNPVLDKLEPSPRQDMHPGRTCTPAGDAAPSPEPRTIMLEEAGLLEAALEVCASKVQTTLNSRLTALEQDLTRFGRARIARALHASLENATQSRWGYYRAVLANIDTLTGSRSTPADDAHPTPASPAHPARPMPAPTPKPPALSMAELIARAPLNGTWGRE
jgi:hypothetical protein